MKPAHESSLPAVLDKVLLAQLLGISVRSLERRRNARTWPFTPIPGFVNRWSRDQVLAQLPGGLRSVPSRRIA